MTGAPAAGCTGIPGYDYRTVFAALAQMLARVQLEATHFRTRMAGEAIFRKHRPHTRFEEVSLILNTASGLSGRRLCGKPKRLLPI